MYKVLGPLYPLLKRLFPKYITNTEELGQAMINAVLYGAEKQSTILYLTPGVRRETGPGTQQTG